MERLIAGQPGEGDGPLDSTLRPRRLGEYVGQKRIKEALNIAMAAALSRGEPLDHLLLYGPPGLGKTTLAMIVAAEMGVSLRITSGPAIERQGEMAAILTSLQPGDVLFIDEFHRLSRTVEEVLYPAMEDFAVDVVMSKGGKGLTARSLRLSLPPFTLIGATTRYAMVSSPLRDRFGSSFRLDFYSPEDLGAILYRSAAILKVSTEEDGVQHLAARARGTPRVANRLLKQVRDYAQVKANGVITGPIAQAALDQLMVDIEGLDQVDHQVLHALIGKFDGGPVGLETLAASISEEPETLMDVYEPYLLQKGFLERTPRGRKATRHAYEHLNIPYPNKHGPQSTLW